ncbi:MAG: chemotaxis protein CheW, partial [Acidobacteria bacterium]|nr:chemotaxis protein CheW [Acidobacteriota bacterium]
MTEAVAHTHSPYAGTTHVVVLVLDELRVGLPLSSVERVVRVVESTMLPGAPDVVRGVVNVQGHVIPVLDVRSRFRLPERAIAPSDLMVIAHTTRRTVALVVDSVTGVLDCSGL